MIDYDIKYIDKEGDHQDFVVTSINARTAMNNLFELCPDARRIISCKPQPMFND
tara:strand:+ start:508 stop:669 length:162 start_codon:yes stop_codon:yes gene_type:complete